MNGRREAWLLVATSALAGFLGQGHASAEVDTPVGTRVFTVEDGSFAPRLRVFAVAGDLAIANRSATAVVRKQDGVLVDFWRNDPAPPSAPQLGSLTHIDGLWTFVPTIFDGRVPATLTTESVLAAGDAVEVVSRADLGAGAVRMKTSYRLAGNEPRLVITTELDHVGGGPVSGLSIGDRVKWGNVDYFIEGRGLGPPVWNGDARWIGRRGAQGDLRVETLEPRPIHISYKQRNFGLMPEISAAYRSASLGPKQSLLVQRTLAYGDLPLPTEPAVPTGRFRARITDEAGAPIAAKLSFRGIGGTSGPNFGNDGDETGVGRFMWSGRGEFERAMPVGRYEVLATAGIERDAARFEVDVREGGDVTVEGRVPRVIETPGILAGDLHLHQVASVDADIACTKRVISIAAEGIEFAVATDHYVVTDYAPTVQALFDTGALAKPIVTVVGSEVSTVGNRFGHFNLFPMTADSNVDYTDTTPKELFAEMRRVSPAGILQVNHPRWEEIGYFHRFKLDPSTGRVPAQFADEYTSDFDSLEIWNGLDVQSEAKLRVGMLDWIHLLGRGHRYTATGNSDSHKLAFHDPGLPRNLIRWGDSSSDTDDLGASPEAVVAAVRRGSVVVTSGPILEVDVAGVEPGGTAKSSSGRVNLHVRVRAAPWIDVREVEVLLGGQARRIRWIPIKPSTAIERLDTTFEVVAPGSTFVVVLARGLRDLPNVHLPKTRPMAVSNPVWIEP